MNKGPDITKLPTQFRSAEIRPLARTAGASADAPTLFEVAVSSEAEIERWYGIEILSHDKGAVDLMRMKRGAAVLVDHRGDQVGVVEPNTARVDSDKVLRAEIRFSRSVRGQEIEQDVQEGIRTSVSVGYLVREMKLTGMRDGVDVYTVTRWQPAEVSLVSVPADPTVGVGRSVEDDEPSRATVENQEPIAGLEGRAMKEVVEVTQEKLAEERKAAVTAERERATEIGLLCEVNHLSAHAPEWIGKGLSLPEVAVEILKARKTLGEATKGTSLEQMGYDLDEVRGYSYARAIMGGIGIREGGKFDGLEYEVHCELERRSSKDVTRRGGVLVPLRLRSGQVEKRTLDSKTSGKGSELMFEQAGELIDLLRNRTAVIMRGARMLTGLTAPIAFPRQTGPMSAFWVGENPAAAVASSDIALGLALLAPKTLQGNTAYSRQMLIQVSIDVEAYVRDEFAKVHSLAIDRSALHGLGAGGEPTGVYKAANVSATAIGGAMTYAKALAMQGQVAAQNADSGRLGWIMHPTMATNLRGTLDFPSAAAGRPIWIGTYMDGTVAGYGASATNQVSATMTGSEPTGGSEIGTVFGNWEDLMIGSWGALELIVDPYSLKKFGMIEVTSFQMCDVLARHGESFSKSTGATG